MGECGDIVSFLNIAVNMDQCVQTSRGTCRMLMEFREDSFKIGLFKVSSYDEDPIWVYSL